MAQQQAPVIIVDAAANLPAGAGIEGLWAYAQAEDSYYTFDGTNWVAFSGGGSNSFTTIDVPSGTDPVADSATDTLTLAAGTGISITGDSGTDTVTIANTGVTSVAMTVPTEFSVSGSPITTTGTLAVSKANQDANLVYAGPSSGAAAAPSFRSLVAADLPDDYKYEYDPNRPPSSLGTGGVSDEFDGGATLSFSWQNQESSTATAELDGLTLYHPTDSTGIAVYWFTGPDGSSTDWAFTAKIDAVLSNSFNQVGLALLATGTEATPTLLYLNMMFAITAASKLHGMRSMTSYTSSQSAIGTDVGCNQSGYLQMRYVSSTKVLTGHWSGDGRIFSSSQSVTLAAHPTTSFGLFVASLSASFPSYGHCSWLRIRTDATGTSAPYPCGE